MKKTALVSVLVLSGIAAATPASVLADAPAQNAAQSAQQPKAQVHPAQAQAKPQSMQHQRLTALQREDARFRRQLNMLESKKAKAEAAKNAKLVARFEKQISNENTRHEKRVQHLAKKRQARTIAKTNVKEGSTSNAVKPSGQPTPKPASAAQNP